MSRADVVRIERSRMADLVDRLGHDDTPLVYTDRNVLVRELFWRRLDALLAISRPPSHGRALDFGGGNGVLTSTLARAYDEVVCVDLRTEMAEELVRSEGLSNVRVRAGAIDELGLADAQFDTIVAADVLEHVHDLDPLIAVFERLLVPGGELLVSAPSENSFYELGRKVFGYTKPDDHYHEAAWIENTIAGRLPLARRRYFPVNVAPLAAFSLGRYVKQGAS